MTSNSMMAIAHCNSGVKSISHVTGRCALFDVKLHFYIYGALGKKAFLSDFETMAYWPKGQNTAGFAGLDGDIQWSELFLLRV